jgi:hypothetical protein
MLLIIAVCRSVLSRSSGSAGKVSSAKTGYVKHAINISALIHRTERSERQTPALAANPINDLICLTLIVTLMF